MVAALERHDGRMSRAARELGMSRSATYAMAARLGVRWSPKRGAEEWMTALKVLGVSATHDGDFRSWENLYRAGRAHVAALVAILPDLDAEAAWRAWVRARPHLLEGMKG